MRKKTLLDKHYEQIKIEQTTLCTCINDPFNFFPQNATPKFNLFSIFRKKKKQQIMFINV